MLGNYRNITLTDKMVTLSDRNEYTTYYGEYKIPKKCSLFDIIKRIASHDIIIHNIIVFRGWNVKDIKENINSRSDLSGEITEHISDGEVLIDLLKATTAKEWAENLLLRAIDRVNGKHDNISVLTVMVTP